MADIKPTNSIDRVTGTKKLPTGEMPVHNNTNHNDIPYNGVIMKPKDFKNKQLISIQDDMLSSIDKKEQWLGQNKIAKILLIEAYKKHEDGEINHSGLFYAIKKQIVQGTTVFNSMEDLFEHIERAEYYTINKNKYGDKYEDKILHSNSRRFSKYEHN